MVLVPAGSFGMGSAGGEPNEAPVHGVTLSAFCIDRTEVTVGAYAACVAHDDCVRAPDTVRDDGYTAADVALWSRACNGSRKDRAAHPINCVDWDQAATFCAATGRRLPTEAEWEYAARGGDGRVYPWGNGAPARLVNACDRACVAMLARLAHYELETAFDDDDGWEATAPVGSFANASPFGALDMAGNVWEWTADWIGPYPDGAQRDPTGSASGTARVFRGGGWFDADAEHMRAVTRYANLPGNRYAALGFRCAASLGRP